MSKTLCEQKVTSNNLGGLLERWCTSIESNSVFQQQSKIGISIEKPIGFSVDEKLDLLTLYVPISALPGTTTPTITQEAINIQNWNKSIAHSLLA